MWNSLPIFWVRFKYHLDGLGPGGFHTVWKSFARSLGSGLDGVLPKSAIFDSIFS